jgi:hypothetical protein
MLNNPHFYNRTIRKIVVGFGSMFNNIQLVRYSKDGLTAHDITKVPLSYGAKEKYIVRINSDPTLTKSIATTVPRMSFDLVGMEYDSSRKQQTTLQNFAFASSKMKTQYAPIPYNFDFSLSIYVRNTEDGTQILEQILPFFTPDFTITIDFIEDMNQVYDMPVMLNSVSPEIEYEGDFMSTRLIIWNLDFTAKAYIWPPVVSPTSNKGLILQANTNIYTDSTNLNAQKVFVDYANGKSGYFTTGEDIGVINKDTTGKVLYFSNTAAGQLVVTDLTQRLDVGDKLVGLYSNSRYTIKTVDSSPTKAVAIVIIPKPAGANVDTAYGFEEIFTEWPDTV